MKAIVASVFLVALFLVSAASTNIESDFTCAKENSASSCVAGRTLSMSTTVRRVNKVFTAHSQKEGEGFIVQRPFPSRNLTDEQTDPFLMLDEFGPKPADANAPGAPWHPHRGFDTVTYMKSGCSAHQDSLGNHGFMQPGEVQWMHTGSGIIHDEGVPKDMTQEELEKYGKQSHGFQLWVNNPTELKMTPPAYHHLTAKTFAWKPWGPSSEVKLFTGSFALGGHGEERSPLELPIPILFADAVVTSNSNGVATEFPIDPEMDTCIVYVYGGEGRVYDGSGDEAGTVIKRQDTVFFSTPVEAAKDTIKLRATVSGGLKVLIMAGKKIGAPVARYGPFVMNTEEEILQAFDDYSGKLAAAKATDNKV